MSHAVNARDAGGCTTYLFATTMVQPNYHQVVGGIGQTKSAGTPLSALVRRGVDRCAAVAGCARSPHPVVRLMP